MANTIWNGKKILITGVNGFIGVHLAARLLREGAHVEGTSRDPSNMLYVHAAGLANAFTIHTLDVANEDRFRALIHQGNFDFVFHLASQSDTWKSIHAPHETMRTNVLGTLHLLEAVRTLSERPKIVLAGTVRAFYDQTNEDSGEGLHPYDASKMSMESIALSYFHAYSMVGAVAKNTNIFGENDLNFSRLVPLIMKQVFTQKKIQLKGDGKLTRDFMYVSDAVDGLLVLASQLDRKDVSGHTFTFATGKNTSIRELCHSVCLGVPGPVSVVFDENETLTERNQPRMTIDRTQKILNWKSIVSLEEGLSRTLEWYQNYFEKVKK